jgi:hypothetical protein
MKKISILYILVFLALAAGSFVYLSRGREENAPAVKTPTHKSESIVLAEGRVSFTVPIDWNAAVNGDSVYIAKSEDVGNLHLVYFSVSPANRPITYGDLNWEQMDFYVSSVDFFTDAFVRSMANPPSGLQVTEIANDSFRIYAQREVLPAGVQPSKDGTGGTTYFLKPKIGNLTWNIVVRKQAIGDSTFEANAEAILKSISFSSKI